MRKQKLIIPLGGFFSLVFCNSVFRSEITPCVSIRMGVARGEGAGRCLHFVRLPCLFPPFLPWLLCRHRGNPLGKEPLRSSDSPLEEGNP